MLFKKLYLLTVCMLLSLLLAAQSNIVLVEYYIDNDPGLGNAIQVSILPAADISGQSINVNTTGLSVGMHSCVIRAKDANGVWSHNNTWLFVKAFPSLAPGTLPNITYMEYYIDNDPGMGIATPVSITPTTDIANATFNINLAPLSIGMHSVVARARDANGIWSHNNTWLFVKAFPSLASGILPKITKVEYYIDNDPGYGKATVVNITPATDLQNIAISLDTSLFSRGVHKVVVRAQDSLGIWSHNNSWLFGKAFPDLAPGIVRGIQYVEYFIDKDPGLGKGIAVSITPSVNLSNLTVNADISMLFAGNHAIYIRAVDSASSWSHVNKLPFKLTVDLATPSSYSISLSGCNQVFYNGKTYTTSTIVHDTSKTSLGHDSAYNTVTITINPNITGNIVKPNKTAIQFLRPYTLSLSGTVNQNYQPFKAYSLLCMPNNSDACIRLSKNNDSVKSNGVSTIDIILTQNHILNKIKLNSPYKIIAADVNNDKNVSTIDIIYMKRLILNLDSTFPGKRLWAFVDSAYVFPDTLHPFPYKDSSSFTNLSGNKLNQSFIAMKLGDVNWDWNPAVAKPSKQNNTPVEFVANIPKVLNFRNVVIPIKVKNFKSLLGMQYTLHIDNNNYEFAGIENNSLALEFNSNQAAESGNISFQWNDANANEKTLEDGTLLFELVLKPKHATDELAAMDYGLSLTNAITNIEAWDKDFNKHDIILTKAQSTIEHDTWTVSPNPTKGVIRINIVATVSKEISFELSNNEGKTLLKQKFEVMKGENVFTINLKKNKLLPIGVYYLKAIGLEGEKVKPLMVE